MSRLSISSTLSQAFAVLAAYPGKLLKWALGPLFLSLVAAFMGLGVFELTGKWWAAAPFGVLALFFWMPFLIRVNQLTVLGRVEPGGYFEKIFDAQSVRCFGYKVMVSLIMGAGMLMAASPALVLGLRHGFDPANQTLILACGVGAMLFMVFLALFSPLNLIFPAVSVEASPSLGRAYTLGAGNKLRLFVAIFAVQLLFAMLSVLVDRIGDVFGGSDKMPQLLVLFPLHLVLFFAGNVLNMIVPAVAYRILRNIPDPLGLPLQPRRSPVDAAPSETPRDASATPGTRESADEPKESRPPTSVDGR